MSENIPPTVEVSNPVDVSPDVARPNVFPKSSRQLEAARRMITLMASRLRESDYRLNDPLASAAMSYANGLESEIVARGDEDIIQRSEDIPGAKALPVPRRHI